MDKISGIIPNSARVAAVDMRDTATVRPGSPSFGRTEGANSLRDREREMAARAAALPTAPRAAETRQLQSTAQNASQTAAAQTAIQAGGPASARGDSRIKDDRGAAIARTMSDKFFVDHRREAEAAPAAIAPLLPTSMEGASEPMHVALIAGEAPADARPSSVHEAETRSLGVGQRGFGAREAMELEAEIGPRPSELYPKGSFIDTRA